MTNDHPIKTLDSRHAWDCPWYGVRQDRIRLPNGSEGVYNVLELPDAVWIVPVTSTGEIALIRTYRYPLQKWGWEVPSGSIANGESPLEAAQRELREEAGGTTDQWRFLIRVSAMNGIGTEYANLFLATGVTLGETAHEATEVMTVHRFPAAEVLRMARAGEINDGMSTLALLLAESELKHG